MERFFTNDVQKAWLKNMVACYAIGFGIGKDVEKTIREKAGVPFATNATDTGVYIMWNTQGGSVKPGSPSAIWPADAVASDLTKHYLPESWGFGENSLHCWDYKAYWDNIRANGLQRIQTWKAANDFPVHSQIPLIGQPIDYPLR